MIMPIGPRVTVQQLDDEEQRRGELFIINMKDDRIKLDRGVIIAVSVTPQYRHDGGIDLRDVSVGEVIHYHKAAANEMPDGTVVVDLINIVGKEVSA